MAPQATGWRGKRRRHVSVCFPPQWTPSKRPTADITISHCWGYRPIRSARIVKVATKPVACQS
jgi:hypothetical protein